MLELALHSAAVYGRRAADLILQNRIPRIATMALKHNYYVRSLQYYAYKRFVGPRRWNSNYLFERAIRRLHHGDIVVDCGAHVGHYTKLLAATGATVHAFEPDPSNFERLKQNLSGWSNAVLHNAAVDISSGHAKLYHSNKPMRKGKNSEGSTLIREKEFIEDDDYVIVEKIDFVSFIRNLDGNVSLIKMDIEGAELDVLERMLESDVLEKIGIMFVETHEKQIPSRSGNFDALRRKVVNNAGRKVYLDWH